MKDLNTIVLAKIPAITLLENVPAIQAENNTFNSKKLTNYAIERILAHTVICHVPAKKLGKARVLSNGEEAIALLNHTKHIQQSQFFNFLSSLPLSKLKETELNIVFLEDRDSAISGELLNMLWIQDNILEGVNNGKLNIAKLENSFLSTLPKGKRISDYITASRKYSYAVFLAINTKTFSMGGKK